MIFWLFVALAATTAIALLWFIEVSRARLTPEDFDGIKFRLYAALAGDLAAPVVAWFIMKAIERRRRRRIA